MGNPWKPFSICPISISICLLLVITTLLVSGCGGGESTESAGVPVVSLPAKTLSWVPPVSYSDDSPLDPATELDSFEIYVKDDGIFTAEDKANAALAAYDIGSAQVTTSFNLANLAPYLSKGVVYHVSLRAVAKNGLKSDFSPSVTFSF